MTSTVTDIGDAVVSCGPPAACVKVVVWVDNVVRGRLIALSGVLAVLAWWQMR